MKRILILLSITAGLLITGCGSGDEGHSHGEGANHSHGQSAQQSEQEHSHNNTGESEHGDALHSHEEGEESGGELTLDETYDEARKGMRLVLAYNADTNSFTGTVENTTEETLPQVRVEVHLSNETELGPTTPIDLDPGESQSIELDASGENFDGWTARPEMGSNEHSHGEGSEHSHSN